MINISGVSTGWGECRSRTSGSAVVIIRVSTGAGWPFEILLDMGADFLRAQRTADGIQRGTRVEARAAAAIGVTDHDIARVRLDRLEWISINGVALAS